MDTEETLSRFFTRAFSTNTTASSITAPTPTATAPSGNGVIDVTVDSAIVANQVLLAFYGVGNAATTATARISAFRQTGDGTIWIPSPLLTLNLTMGSQIGVANGLVTASEHFVSTITAGTAFTTAYEIISPGSDNTVALVAIDPKGASRIKVDLAIGTCTSVNVLWSVF